MCTFAQERKHKKKPLTYLTIEIIKKICNELVQHGCFFQNISLSVSGEPLLHPKFKDIISYLYELNTPQQKFFKYISINTNGTLLTQETVTCIHDALQKHEGSLNLTISLNAASKESFIASKKVDLFEKSVKNIKYLLQDKHKRRLDFHEVVYLQFLVNEENKDEAKKFRNYWKKQFEKIGTKYTIDYGMPIKEGFHNAIIFKKTYANENFNISQEEYDFMHQEVAIQLGLTEDKKQEGKIQKKPQTQKHIPLSSQKQKRRICGSPWISPVIRHDGTVSICLNDTDALIRLGNINEESFIKIWFSPIAEHYRMKHIENRFAPHEHCYKCTYFDGESISEDIIEKHRDLIRMDHLL